MMYFSFAESMGCRFVLSGAVWFAGTLLMNRQARVPGFDPAASADSACRSMFFDRDRTQLIDELLSAHDYERQRLGQELHDSAGQLIVALHLSVARLRIDNGGSGHDELIDDIQETVRRIDQEIRSLAFLHRPAELDGRDLPCALARLVSGFGKRTGTTARFDCDGDYGDLAEDRAAALLRVAQEALVNVHRHAHASSVNVALRRVGDAVELSATDDGVGIPTHVLEEPHGVGLQGMRHRTEMFGGGLDVESDGRGTRVAATLPYAA